MSLTFEELRAVNLERCGVIHSGPEWDSMQWGCATAGEIGEACNVAKKIGRFEAAPERAGTLNKGSSREELVAHLATEIAGALIYLDLWAAHHGIDLEDAVRNEFNRKSGEWGLPHRL